MITQESFAEQSSTFVSQSGYVVNLNSKAWRLDRDTTISIEALQEHVSEDMYRSMVEVLKYYSISNSPHHVANLFERCKHYFLHSKGQELFSPTSLISYRSMIGKKREWYLGTLRGFIRQWHRLGLYGISDQTIALLEGWRIGGNEKGYAVQSMCPDEGPLTDIEMQGFVERALHCYSIGQISLTHASLVLTLALTGRRPAQLTSLKLKDLIERNHKFWINFPRAKQHGGKWRQTFKMIPVDEDLWALLRQQANQTVIDFELQFGVDAVRPLVKELPLFAYFKRSENDLDLKSQLEFDILHAPTGLVGEAVRLVSDVTKVSSERTGQSLHLNPRRFRYTLGTNLAREGKGEYIIAEALDHSDTQNAGVYVKNIPEIVERIDKAVALQLAPIAQAFQGVIVRTEKDTERGNDPSSRIYSARGGVGSCGSFGFCGALAPVACYSCSYFRPWLDGPHEKILNGLIEERDQVLSMTGDKRIASVNDRLILAVGDVVRRCKSMTENANE